MDSVGPGIAKMIGNEPGPIVYENGSVEVMENKESREPETGAPERIRNPGVHVIIIPGRRVVSDDWRAFIVVVVINDFGSLVLTIACWWLIWSNLTPGISRNRQTRLSGKVLKCIEGLIPAHC
jgi:hypothetical protein